MKQKLCDFVSLFSSFLIHVSRGTIDENECSKNSLIHFTVNVCTAASHQGASPCSRFAFMHLWNSKVEHFTTKEPNRSQLENETQLLTRWGLLISDIENMWETAGNESRHEITHVHTHVRTSMKNHTAEFSLNKPLMWKQRKIHRMFTSVIR